MAMLAPIQGQAVGSSQVFDYDDPTKEIGISFTYHVERTYPWPDNLAKLCERWGFGTPGLPLIPKDPAVTEKCKKWANKDDNRRTAATFVYFNEAFPDTPGLTDIDIELCELEAEEMPSPSGGRDVCPSLETDDKDGDGAVTLEEWLQTVNFDA